MKRTVKSDVSLLSVCFYPWAKASHGFEWTVDCQTPTDRITRILGLTRDEMRRFVSLGIHLTCNTVVEPVAAGLDGGHADVSPSSTGAAAESSGLARSNTS